jgi:FkbM family methyltransferase
MATIIDLAVQHHQAGRISEALEIYELVLGTDPAPPAEILYLAGMAYLATARHEEAESYLARAIASIPDRADFHSAHGNALSYLSRHEDALAAFRHAASLAPDNAALWFNLGNAANACALPDEAVAAFRKAVDLDPAFKQALANLANTLLDQGRADEYCLMLQQVYDVPALNPRFMDVARLGILRTIPAGADNLGSLLEGLAAKHDKDARPMEMLGFQALVHSRFDRAETCYRKAHTLDPASLEARAMLGFLLAAREAAADAIPLLQQSNNETSGGELLRILTQFELATTTTRRRTALLETVRAACPYAYMITHYYLFHMIGMNCRANVLAVLGLLMPDHRQTSLEGASLDECFRARAIEYLETTVMQYPDEYLPWLTLSILYDEDQQKEKAIPAAQWAVDLNRFHAGAWLHRARLALSLDMSESIRILDQALVYQRESIELLDFMGALQMRVGNMQGAIGYLDRARALIGPGMGEKLLPQLLVSNYRADLRPETVAEMHFTWGAALEGSLADQRLPARSAKAKSRLRVGYVSGDYQTTSPSYFMLPLMAHHDRSRIEIVCYSTQAKDDDLTPRFKQLARCWRDVGDLTDGELADMIRADGIDILVDLSGHTMGGRLGAFALKPAPVQVTWLGYPNTTGLSSIDYRFTDAQADPAGDSDAHHSETLVRLPHFLCYQPPDHTPVVAKPPCRQNGHVTFGCFNNSNKINDAVVEAWVEILMQVPTSRLIMKTAELADEKTAAAFRAKFSDRGIAPERIDCYPSVPSKFDHLGIYSLIDLSLDPFPYNGTTTTFESLWMGVPVLTLSGNRHAARVGDSILTGIGLPELVTTSREDYIATAVALARNPSRLTAYRTGMRERLQESPLMDAASFAASVETAYFSMWARAVDAGKDHDEDSSPLPLPPHLGLRECRHGAMLYMKNDLVVGRALEKYGEFSEAESDLFRKIVMPGMTVVDAGANIGSHTVSLAMLAGSLGIVHAFEPQRALFQVMCANVALNGHYNVFPHQAGLGADAGVLHIPPVDYTDPRIANFAGIGLSDDNKGETVPIVTLDDLSLERLDFFKMDVEGMEQEVLAGGRRTIERHRPVLFVENDVVEHSESLIAQIRAMDYRLFWHISSPWRADNFRGDPENIFGEGTSNNMLCLPNEKLRDYGLPEVLDDRETWMDALKRYGRSA